MHAGLSSVAAIRLASTLRRDSGIDVQATLLFEYPTARAIATHLQDSGAMVTPHSILAVVAEALASVGGTAAGPITLPPPGAQHVAPSRVSTIGLDDIFVSSGLTCMRPADCGIPLVCVPAGNGHADGYRPLASVIENPIYGAIQPHLQSGSHLHTAKLEQLADAWASAILQQCECLPRPGCFFLISASLGGLLAHQTALAAHSRGRPARLLILLDPLPPVRPLSTPLYAGSFVAARMLSILAGDEDYELPAEVAEADLVLLLADRDVELGRAPFTSAILWERQRELRAATHLLDLAAAFTGQDAGPGGGLACRVCLVVASEREAFFTKKTFLKPAESSVATARRYGHIVEELEVPGTHLAVCSRCVTGDADEFNAVLRNLAHDEDKHDERLVL